MYKVINSIYEPVKGRFTVIGEETSKLRKSGVEELLLTEGLQQEEIKYI